MKRLTEYTFVHIMCLVLSSASVFSNTTSKWERMINDKTGNPVNTTKLLSLYTLICPLRKICDRATPDHIYVNSTNYYTHLNDCPRCVCDYPCVFDKTCCPDMRFAYAHIQCVNTLIFPELDSEDLDQRNLTKSVTGTKFYLVDTCQTANEYKDKCERYNLHFGNSEIPVTALQSGIAYKNEMCALCNGESEYVQWQVQVRCLQGIPGLYQYSSLRDMHAAVLNNSCVVFYEHAQQFGSVPCGKDETSQQYTFGSCNQSGLWQEYDPEVDWACANLQTPFNQFKNVFCYICNPSIVLSERIETIARCNETGKLMTKMEDVGTEVGCLNGSAIERLAPYKNVYCLLCNGIRSLFALASVHLQHGKATIKMNNSNVSLTETNLSMSITVSTPDGAIKPVLTTITKLLNAVTDNVTGDVARSAMHDNGYRPTMETTSDSAQVDVLVSGYQAVCSDMYACNDSTGYSLRRYGLGNSACPMCNCRHSCIVLDRCCTDKLLKNYPYSCSRAAQFLSINNALYQDYYSTNTPGPMYKLIDNCPYQPPSDITRKCVGEHSEYPDPITYIPVHKIGTTSYRNIYCAACFNDSFHTTFIDVEIRCRHFVEANLFPKIESFLSVVKRYCSFAFIPWDRAAKCHSDDDVDIASKNVINKCNSTGIWPSGDGNEAIVNACEGNTTLVNNLDEYNDLNGARYRNVYCYICNPDVDAYLFDANSTITDCNKTGLWEGDDYDDNADNYISACQQSKSFPRWLPFKSYDCYFCNSNQTSDITIGNGHSNDEDDVKPPSYRTLFSLTPSAWQSMSRDNIQALDRCYNGTYDHIKVNQPGMLLYRWFIGGLVDVVLSLHCRAPDKLRICKHCRSIYCSRGRILQNGSCNAIIEIATGLLYELSFGITSVNVDIICNRTASYTDTEPVGIALGAVVADIQDKIQQAVANWTAITFQRVEGLVSTECVGNETGEKYVDVCDFVHGLISLQLFINYTENRTMVENTLAGACSDRYIVYLSSINTSILLQAAPNEDAVVLSRGTSDLPILGCRYIDHVQADTNNGHDHTLDMTFGMANINMTSTDKNTLPIHKFVTCAQVQLQEGEFTFDNLTKTITIHNGRKTINRNDFNFINKSTVRICYNDYLTMKSSVVVSTNIILQRAYTIFSYACTSISLCCLLATFVTYSMFSVLRTLPGKNNMCLTCALFWAQLSLHVRVWGTMNSAVCAVLGGVIHYSWLATFCAMNACSFHMYHVFCSQELAPPIYSQSKKRFFCYTAYIFGLPALAIIATVSVYFILSRGEFSGYGGPSCFIIDVFTTAMAFIGPACIILMSNIIFFVFVFLQIRHSPRVPSSRTVTDKEEFILYVKLCTITGITWPLQIVDANLPLTVFSFFVVAINASQGLFIFMSYTCNRRVICLYKGLLRRKTKYETQVTALAGVYQTDSTQMSDLSLSRSSQHST